MPSGRAVRPRRRLKPAMTITKSGAPSELAEEAARLLHRLGVSRKELEGGSLEVGTPISGETIARVRETSPADASGSDRPGGSCIR